MIEAVKKQRVVQFTVVFYLLFFIFWIYIFFKLDKSNGLYQVFSATYGLMALYGACLGFAVARKWTLKSLIGKAILMFSLGLLAQEFGQLAYSYYAYFLHIEIPYPSIGDIGYFGSIFLYVLGVIYLAQASGVIVSLKSFENKLQAVIIPLALLIYSYVVFLQHYSFDFSKPMTIFLDFGYPLGQAVYVSIAILTVLLSRGILGGIMKYRILFLVFALLFQYFSDYMYLFQAHEGSAYPGGPNDIVYLTSYLLMTLAILQLRMSTIKSKLS